MPKVLILFEMRLFDWCFCGILFGILVAVHFAFLRRFAWYSCCQKLGILAVQPLGGERKELAETWQGKIIGL